jgi:hypothetical protein
MKINESKNYIVTYWTKNRIVSKIKKGIELIQKKQNNIINIWKLQK